MKAVYTVGHRRYHQGGRDAHGNAVEGWDPVIPLKVFSIAPTTSGEPEKGRDAAVTGQTLLVPPGATIDYRDRFEIDGDVWEVSGEVADYTRGPFGWASGISVQLTRARG